MQAVITTSPPQPPPQAALSLLISQIDFSSTNPRKIFDPADHADLTESVKIHGVIQPILVRPASKGTDKFELVAGERRLRAATAAGLTEIMTVCQSLSDVQALEIQVIENLQRVDLHPLEEAEGYERLLADHDYTVAMLAGKVNKSATYIYGRLKLCALTPENRKLFYEGKLNPTTALLLARIPVATLQNVAGVDITSNRHRDDGMSIGDAVRYVHENYMLELKRAPFPCEDALLVDGAGACGACPKRTGNQVELFGDVKSKSTCTDPVCFGAKRDAHATRQKLAAELNGQKVITGEEAKKILPYDSSTGNAGWMRLDAKCYEDKKQRTYKAILGKAAPVPTLVQMESGEMVEVVRLSEIADTLKLKGVKMQERSVHGNVDKAREKEARRETEIRMAIFTAVRAKYPAALDANNGLREIAASWLESCGSDKQRAICKVWGWKFGDYKDRQVIAANLDALDAKGLSAVLLDLALIGEVRCHTYSTMKPVDLLTTAKRVKVDADKIRATMVAEAKAAAKAKAAPKSKVVKPAKPKVTKPAAAAKK